MIKRDIAVKILNDLNYYPVLAIVGPRQSGKTTLAKNIFKDKPYINLEDLENRSFAQDDPKGFLAQFPNGVVIDEVQRVPELLSYIQVIVDKKKQNGMYILTGSQNFLLMESVSQSLAGRVSIFNLLPLSVSELKNAQLSKNTIADTLFTGFYPKLFSEPGIDISGYYSNYIQTYVERDLRLISNIINLSLFRKFLILCAARTGQLLNVSSLANDAGVSHKTAREWLSLLELSMIIYLLRPYHQNFGKRVVKMPKIYFFDTGLLCNLLNITDASQVKSHYLKGGIFESFIITEILKYRYNNAQNPNIYFWRDKLGNEVDLILEQADKTIAVEIKSGATITKDYFKSLKYYKKLAGETVANMYVIYGGEENQKRTQAHIFGWRDLAKELPLRGI